MNLRLDEIRRIIIFTFIIFSVVYFISLYGLTGLYYPVLIPLILFFFSIQKEFIVVLYLIVLPSSGIIPSEQNFLEAFGFDEIINIITVLYFINYKFIKYKFFSLQKQLTLLIIYLIVFVFLLNLKNAYFQIYDGEYFLSLKRTLFSILKYLPIFFIIKYYGDKKLRQYIILGLLMSGVIFVTSQIFNEHLSNINLITIDDSEFGYFPSDVISRFAGFYNGDANSLGAYLIMLIGLIFILSENIQKRTTLYILISFFILGVFITASRTAIISLFIIFLLFWFNNKSNKVPFQLALILLIPAYFGYDFILNQLSRFETAGLQFSTSIEDNRVVKWISYLQFMIESPEYVITGAQQEINIRSAHNVFIQMFYNIGIFPVIIFTFTLLKSFHFMIKMYKNTILYILPFLFIIITVGELNELSLFIIISSVVFGEYIISKNKSKKIKNS
tara:strand:- start:4919 stop:6253 length:1335 start_codon:yes stop_codon:yes gene_type:complete